MANRRPFHIAHIVPVFSLNKMTQCKAGNPSFKWTSLYNKKKERKESPLKRDFLRKQRKVELVSTHTSA